MAEPDPLDPMSSPVELHLPQAFWIEGWLIQPGLNRMEQDGKTIQVEPKVMQVLTYLAHHAGEPVTRDQLLASVWAGTIVTDDALTRCISELRKLFNDTPRQPRVVETIPRIGYRLLAPVTPSYQGDSVPRMAPVVELTPSLSIPEVAQPKRKGWLWPAISLVLLVLVATLLWQRSGSVTTQTALVPLQATPLTAFPGRESMAAFSPSGEQVAFLWSQENEPGNLYVMSLDAQEPLQLTNDMEDKQAFTWSPDGRFIAFARRTTASCGLFVIPALGGPERKLTDCFAGSFVDLTWSPDGQFLITEDRASADENYALYQVDATTGDKERLTYATEGSHGDFQPRYSPDGQHLVFIRSLGEGQTDLFRLDLHDHSLQQITFEKKGIADVEWSADGTHLIFSSNREGLFGYWTLPARGGVPTWLGLPDGILRGTLSGKQMVYERHELNSNIYRINRNRPEVVPEPMCPSSQRDTDPRFAPDGKRLLFISNRSGDRAVWMCDADGTNPTQLTFHTKTQVFGPSWSPDGQRIAYTVFVDGQAEIYVLDHLGGEPRALTDAASNEVFPSWSHDGRWIYFGSDRTGTMQIWKQPVGGGEATQVTQDGGYISKETTDGTSLYYFKEGQNGLWKRSVAGGPEKLVLPNFDLRTAFSWTLHPDGLYYLSHTDPASPALVRHDLVTETAHPILNLSNQLLATGLSLSPDGEHVFFSRIDKREADLMIVTLP